MSHSRRSVSVVIPCYNAEGYLRETLDSVLGQTCTPLEVIVVDDGSTDESAAIAESYGHPVRVISQRNQGAGAARFAGARSAGGEFIAFNDADDEMPRHKLEILADGLAAHPDCVASCGFTLITRMGRSPRCQPSGGILDGRHEVIRDPLGQMLGSEWPLATAMNIMCRRRDLLECIGKRPFPPAANDYDLQLRLALRGPFVRVASVTASYAEHQGGISSDYGISRQMAYALLSASAAVSACALSPSARAAWTQRVERSWARIFVWLVAERQWTLAAKVAHVAIRHSRWPSCPRRVWWAVDAHFERAASPRAAAAVVRQLRRLRNLLRGGANAGSSADLLEHQDDCSARC
jgi:GT2 family glycosyltransferase